MSENWESINASDSVKELLGGVSEHTVYACTGSYMLLDVHTYKVDRDTGLVENKIVKLHTKKLGLTQLFLFYNPFIILLSSLGLIALAMSSSLGWK